MPVVTDVIPYRKRKDFRNVSAVPDHSKSGKNHWTNTRTTDILIGNTNRI